MRALVLCLLLVSCVRRNGQREVVIWEDRLRDLAGFQMQCDPETLRVVDLHENVGVIGCGQRRLYWWDQGERRWKEQIAPPAAVAPLPDAPAEPLFQPHKVE